MSALVKLSSKLPGDPEINGLDAIAADLIAVDPTDEVIICALVWITPREVRRVVATGDEIPVVEVRRIEPLGSPDDLPAEVVQLTLDLQAKRTGRTPLPIAAVEPVPGEIDELEDEDPVVVDGPRLSQDPAQIGEIYSFQDDDDELETRK